MDLGRYLEARFSGMTPGQQLAELAMVSERERKAAGGSVAIAMSDKARQLARDLGCESKEAMAILVKGLTELMPYVHQRQAQAAPKDAAAVPVVYVIPDDAGVAPQQLLEAVDEPDPDAVEILEDLTAPAPQVSRPKSHD